MKSIVFLLFSASIFVLSETLDLARYRQEALAQHNVFRSQCSVDPLQANATLDAIALDWCRNLSVNNKFDHSGAIDYGENSYKKTPFDFQNDNGATPVLAWFSEKSNYNEATPENALHFTQIVWKNTKSMGTGVCNITDGGVLFVVNYYPRGNYKDQFSQNILCK